MSAPDLRDAATRERLLESARENGLGPHYAVAALELIEELLADLALVVERPYATAAEWDILVRKLLKASLEPIDCPHMSYTGVDQAEGPGKVWRCDGCGWTGTLEPPR